MKDKQLNISMNTDIPYTYGSDTHWWPQLVLRTAAAYADIKKADKYNSVTGLETVIYGNFLWR